MDADYRIFKRKLYERMLNWKHTKDGNDTQGLAPVSHNTPNHSN